MEKRAQFYLIAAFVVISIISGLVYTYNYARVSSSDFDSRALAGELDYEVGELINNRLFDGTQSANEISQEIRLFIEYYDDLYLNVKIKVIYGSQSEAFVIDSSGVNSFSPIAGIVSDNINGIDYEVDIRNKNYYTIVVTEKDEERDFVII